MLKVGIVGGTGYTGAELLRILVDHPQAEVAMITSRGEAGVAARRGRLLEHGMASRLGPGRGRTPGWDVGPGEGRGVCILAPSRLPAPAGKG